MLRKANELRLKGHVPISPFTNWRQQQTPVPTFCVEIAENTVIVAMTAPVCIKATRHTADGLHPPSLSQPLPPGPCGTLLDTQLQFCLIYPLTHFIKAKYQRKLNRNKPMNTIAPRFTQLHLYGFTQPYKTYKYLPCVPRSFRGSCSSRLMDKHALLRATSLSGFYFQNVTKFCII